MANPAALTINSLVANSSLNQPAAQTIDTDGTVSCAAGSLLDRLFLEIVNAAAAVLTVTVKAGTGEHAHTALDLAISMAATGAAGDKKLIGPFEAARFVKPDGSIDVAFLAASGSPNATVRVYRLPRQI